MAHGSHTVLIAAYLANENFKIGVAIGDQIVDLQGTGLIDSPDMSAFI
jgi:fumarylacetoacetase